MKKILLVAGMFASLNANANLIVNGSFESQSNVEGAFTRFSDGVNPLTGWTIATGSGNPYVETRNSIVGEASDGENFAELDVSDPLDSTFNTGLGGMFQVVNIASAGLYDFSFDYAGRPGTVLSTNQIQFSLFDSADALVIPQVTLNPTLFNTDSANWNTYINQFNLSAGNYTFLFREVGTQDGLGTSLDNVVLVASETTTAVPEPETYGMMMLGLAMLGFASRRRKA